MQIKLLVEGGNMKPGPQIGQKLGPLGINIGKVIEEVNKSTLNFRGMKVPVVLDVDTKTKNFNIKILTPPTLELIKKELGIEKASGDPKKIKVGNLAIEQIIKISKIKQKDLMVKNLKSAVKTVIGSCVSAGILIEGKDPKMVLREIEKGKYDSEIKEGKTEVSQEKLKRLKEKFEKIKEKQEEYLKKLEEEAKKAEEKKEKEEKVEEEKKEEEKEREKIEKEK